MKYIASTVSSICILTALLFAMANNIDGLILGAGLTILGGLGGFVGHDLFKKKP